LFIAEQTLLLKLLFIAEQTLLLINKSPHISAFMPNPLSVFNTIKAS